MPWYDDIPMEPLNIKTEINVELLLKIKEQVLANPKHVDMDSWLRVGNSDPDSLQEFGDVGFPKEWIGDPERFTACNTTACLAGWAVLLSPDAKDYEGEHISFAARLFLGLSVNQSDLLFHLSFWPTSFYEEYTQAKTPQERAQAVADRIDHFITTNGEE
jgi:hypothetical protein